MASSVPPVAAEERQLVGNASANVFIWKSPLELEFNVSAQPAHALLAQNRACLLIHIDAELLYQNLDAN